MTSMILRFSPASPYVRKVRIAAEILGITNKIKLEDADVRSINDTLLQQNPLGKIPALILENDEVLYDSRVIVEYLDSLAGGGIIPTDKRRFEVLRNQSLADGIMDAAVLYSYELRFRTAEQQSTSWINNQQGKIERALMFAEQHLTTPVSAKVDIGQIALACALGYLDLRFDGKWRAKHPKLVQWLNDFSDKVPMFNQTVFKG